MDDAASIARVLAGDLEASLPATLALTERLVAVDSGSLDLAGVNTVSGIVGDELAAAGFAVERDRLPGRPDLVRATWQGGEGLALPAPQTLQPWPMTSLWPGDYIASLDVRLTTPPAPGRATAWVNTPLQLVEAEPSSDLARVIALVDTANGIAVRRSPREWMFPNVDLTIHLHRQPTGNWVGLDTTVIFGTGGHGLTSTVLHDVLGPVGQASQTLTVRPLS